MTPLDNNRRALWATAAALLLLHCQTGTALAVLVPGDIGLVQFSTDQDRFAWVALSNIASGEQLHFTTASWQGFSPGAFRAGEHIGGPLTWTNSTGNTINAGTVIRFTTGGFTLGSTSGTTPNLRVTGDQLFAFQGAWGSPQFVFGAQFATSTANQGIVNAPTVANDVNDTNIPGTLSLGTTFHNLENNPNFNSSDNGTYTGPTTFANSSAALSALANTANWTYSNSPQLPSLIPLSFTIAPEPSTFILLAAAGGVGAAVRRRRQRTASGQRSSPA